MKAVEGVVLAEFLNVSLQRDRAAIEALFGQRVPCNPVTANHPKIAVTQLENGETVVGFLGLLNGIFADGEWPRGDFLYMVKTEAGAITKFVYGPVPWACSENEADAEADKHPG